MDADLGSSLFFERATVLGSVKALADYIDEFYNVERLHSANDYVSPVEFELHSALLQEAA